MSDEDLSRFGEWLQVLGLGVEKTPVGLSVTDTEIAFATTEQGWLLPRNAFTQAAKAVTRKALFSERSAPAYCVRGTANTVLKLRYWYEQEEINGLLPNIINDMASLQYVTGRAVAHGLTALKDALDCATVAPMMALEASNFYREVDLPNAKHNATYDIDHTGDSWTLKYDWLLFKVCAHYAKDPTMTRWFQDGVNPLSAFTEACGGLTTEESTAFLMWLVCGEDEVLLSRRHPDWAARLPEAPQLVKAAYIDKNLPSFRMGLIRLYDNFKRARRSTTMYGRRSSWGWEPQELLYFAIMGSVDDIIDVAMASLLKMGSKEHWLDPDTYNPWNRAIIRGHLHTSEDSLEWERKVEVLGQLGSPLGIIDLEPKVSVV